MINFRGQRVKRQGQKIPTDKRSVEIAGRAVRVPVIGSTPLSEVIVAYM